jgi:dienelactone hydrolase
VPDTIADIDAVFKWLLRRGVLRQDIILYGQSLGSGPTLDLAAREPAIAAVVLHAAFASGARCSPDWKCFAWATDWS